MATVSTYLNFERNTEEAFKYYETVFGTTIAAISRMGDMPPTEGAPEVPEADKNLVINVQLPILGGHMLMGTDNNNAMGPLVRGNNVHIMLNPDSREELDRLFAALSDGGKVVMQPQDMFWGDYYAACADKFGINWMLNFATKA